MADLKQRERKSYPVIKPGPAEWPEVVCAENPHFGGSDQHIPTANTPEF